MSTKNEVKVVNHWGKWVKSDEPITGVCNSNSIAWEFITDTDEICLDCESMIKDHNDTHDDDCDCLDWLECDSSHTRLIGDWTQDTKTGLYEPDKTGEFVAIENEVYVQVVWSKFTRKCALCSPCYPGQGDLDSTGDFLTYCLPSYLTDYSDLDN